MKRQEEWIDKAMNSTNGLIQAQPSDNLRTKTLLRMNAASKQNIFSIPLQSALPYSFYIHYFLGQF